MIPACAHLTVSAHDNGWSCRDCGTRFVIDRHAPLTPWSTLAAVVEERNRYFAEVAALRSQVEELMQCGVAIHKAAQGAVDYERERVRDLLIAMEANHVDPRDQKTIAAARDVIMG